MNAVKPSRQHKRKTDYRRFKSSRSFVTQDKLRAALRNSSPQIHLQGAGVHPRKHLHRTQLRAPASNSFFSRVYALVRKIPRGRVVTYGQIARALGVPHGARTVGWAMRDCPDDVPWHRVVNAQGKISVRPTNGYHEQRARLKEEGVKFDREGKIDLARYEWKRI